MPDSPTPTLTPDLRQIPLREIAPNPSNPRKHMDEAALAELARSIAEHGLMQPITVRRNPRNEMASFDIVCGHRRYAAARLNAGADLGVTLPCLVRELTDRQVQRLRAATRARTGARTSSAWPSTTRATST